LYEPGDALLFTLSAWRETAWGRFKSTLDALRPRLSAEEDGEEGAALALERMRVARLLAILGHCDLVYGEEGPPRLIAAPPVLALLPVPGLPRAVLCGSRSPATAAELAAACQMHGAAVDVWSQSGRARFAPSRIEVEADSHGLLQRVAATVRVPSPETPPAWALASAAGSMDEYLGSLEWSSEPELNWDSEDFDARALRFTPRRAAEGAFRLSRYRHPVRLRWVYRLWREGQSAAVDPAWGRYAILAANSRRVVAYDAAAAAVAVPIWVPLPVPLARALALCSGLVPRLVNRGRLEIYDRVPKDVAEEVTRRVGQAGWEPTEAVRGE
jgi:hypothetical protein